MNTLTSAARRRVVIEIIIAVIIFIPISILYFYASGLKIDTSLKIRQIFGGIYTAMALYGGIVGIRVSKNWGGYKSLVGRATMFLAIGLFLQTFGQISNSVYNVFLKVAVPYPSLGDVGFFGSVLAYIYSAFLLCKMSGSNVSLNSIKNKIWAFIIPAIILVFSYVIFLNGYEFDWTNKLKVFLDFGYPLGQALYISLAILALLISRNIAGGIMRKPVLFLILALAFDYFADFVFLYQVSKNTWCTGCINDFQYFLSYSVMTLCLIYFGFIFNKIQNT